MVTVCGNPASASPEEVEAILNIELSSTQPLSTWSAEGWRHPIEVMQAHIMIGYLAFAQHWITETSLLQLFLERSYPLHENGMSVFLYGRGLIKPCQLLVGWMAAQAFTVV